MSLKYQVDVQMRIDKVRGVYVTGINCGHTTRVYLNQCDLGILLDLINEYLANDLSRELLVRRVFNVLIIYIYIYIYLNIYNVTMYKM